MAINQNHLFEDLDGLKCAIVEKNVFAKRVAFLKSLLVYNGYTVVVVASPPPKVPAAAASAVSAPAAASLPAGQGSVPVLPSAVPGFSTPDSASTASEGMPSPAVPETFTVGVTDTTFNPTNAIFGRLLRTSDGHVVTLAYWRETENESHDEIPYFESGKS